MSIFQPNFEHPGIGPENEPPRSPVYLFFRNLGTRFFKLILLNIVFFVLVLPFYCWFINRINMYCVDKNIGIIGMLPAVISYAAGSFPEWLCVLLFVISALVLGPACAGLTYVVFRYASGEHAWVVSDFIDVAIKNLIQALPIGLLDVIVAYATQAYLFSEELPGLLLVLWCILLYLYIGFRSYIYILIDWTDLSLFDKCKNAIILGLISGWRITVLILVIIALLIAAGYIDFILVPVFAFSFFSFSACALVRPVLKKHLNFR